MRLDTQLNFEDEKYSKMDPFEFWRNDKQFTIIHFYVKLTLCTMKNSALSEMAFKSASFPSKDREIG